MISLAVYKWVHFIGIFMLFSAFGGLVVASQYEEAKKAFRKRLALLHGGGLFLILLGGFGMLARLGVKELPVWIYYKLGIWLVLGGMFMLFKRRPQGSKIYGAIVLALGALAAYIAIFNAQI